MPKDEEVARAEIPDRVYGSIIIVTRRTPKGYATLIYPPMFRPMETVFADCLDAIESHASIVLGIVRDLKGDDNAEG